ncbi:MAG: MBL fold metallo-hydrolase [Deltaproteobacteria bacterium]
MSTRRSNPFAAALVVVLACGGCDSSPGSSRTIGSSLSAAGNAATETAGGTSGAGSSGSGGSNPVAGSGSSEVGGPSGIVGLMGTGNSPSTDTAGSDTAGSTGSGADAAPGVEPVTGTLRLFFVDSEGGQSTVIQLPNGQILVIDTGNAGMRDGERMLAVLQGELGATQIDYLIITHYDGDHVGGVPYLAARIGIGQFFDHGAANAPAQYLALANAGTRRALAAGDVLTLGGVTLNVVSAAGTVITQPLAGGGMPNPLCEGAQTALPGDPLDENVNSVGVVLRFGSFDFLDLGDLLWPREHQLACPNNQIGPIDLYLTTHHGLTRSGAPQLVRALQPLAAIMNNGPRKGGGGSTWATLALAPGPADVWQVHRAVAAPDAQNAPLAQIANLDEGQADAAQFLEVRVESSGQFQILNPRTSFSKAYTSR